MKLSVTDLETYLTQRFGSAVQIVALEPLGDTAIAAVEDRAGAVRQLKTYG